VGGKEREVGCITYKGGYKYQLKQDYTVEIPIKPDTDLNPAHGFISLSSRGEMRLNSGYAWDGPSGPTFDTLNFMRGSLVHDALYQLMRDGDLDDETYRKKADQLLRAHCREDGMTWSRAAWVYLGVRLGGGPSADPDRKRPLQNAPRGCS
jgi:hypothetical protein